MGSYPVAGLFAEPVPNAEGDLGVAGIQLRTAVCELTWKPKDKAKLAEFEQKLSAWRAAVRQGPPAGLQGLGVS